MRLTNSSRSKSIRPSSSWSRSGWPARTGFATPRGFGPSRPAPSRGLEIQLVQAFRGGGSGHVGKGLLDACQHAGHILGVREQWQPVDLGLHTYPHDDQPAARLSNLHRDLADLIRAGIQGHGTVGQGAILLEGVERDARRDDERLCGNIPQRHRQVAAAPPELLVAGNVHSQRGRLGTSDGQPLETAFNGRINPRLAATAGRAAQPGLGGRHRLARRLPVGPCLHELHGPTVQTHRDTWRLIRGRPQPKWNGVGPRDRLPSAGTGKTGCGAFSCGLGGQTRVTMASQSRIAPRDSRKYQSLQTTSAGGPARPVPAARKIVKHIHPTRCDLRSMSTNLQ